MNNIIPRLQASTSVHLKTFSVKIHLGPGAGMVDSAALRAVVLYGREGSSPSLGTLTIGLTGTSSSVERSLWEREVQGSIPWSPTKVFIEYPIRLFEILSKSWLYRSLQNMEILTFFTFTSKL